MIEQISTFNLDDIKKIEGALKERKKSLKAKELTEKQERIAKAVALSVSLKVGSKVSFIHNDEIISSVVKKISKGSFTTEAKNAKGGDVRKGFQFLTSVEN
jgi:predicted transcriptional regulator